MLIVQPEPKRNWYRYSSEQMSSPLPATLYKYLPGRYAASMIDRGELMFSTLAWFQNYEDDQRGDRFEGTPLPRAANLAENDVAGVAIELRVGKAQAGVAIPGNRRKRSRRGTSPSAATASGR